MTKCDLYAARLAGADNCDFCVRWLLWNVTWKLASNRRYLFVISALLEDGVLKSLENAGVSERFYFMV